MSLPAPTSGHTTTRRRNVTHVRTPVRLRRLAVAGLGVAVVAASFGCGGDDEDADDIASPVATDDDIITTDAAQDRCSGTLKGCKFRFGENGQLRYGSFPTAGRIG